MIYKATDQWDESLRYCQEALKIRKQLKNTYPKSPKCLAGYSISLEKLAEIYKAQKKLNQRIR